MTSWIKRLFARVTSPLSGRAPSLYVIYLVSVLHIVWAGLLFGSAESARSTPVSAVVDMFGGRPQAVAVLAVAAIMAMIGAYLHRNPRHVISPTWLAIALMPQQFLLLISAIGGVDAAIRGHYADGVLRPWQFIVGDQLPVILIALLYTTAIFVVARTQKLERKT